jgi:glycerol-3-phosphate dehydrogenase subunit B
MKFQTIIIGGGLSALVAGIKLQKAGQKVAIISSGQSTLHFSSGSFELLNVVDGKAVANPLEAIKGLPAEHPYSKIENVEALVEEVVPLMHEAGIELSGDAKANHYHLTPLGKVKPAWLTEAGFLTFPKNEFPYKKVALYNLAGFLDFYPQFLTLGLQEMGVDAKTYLLTAPKFEKLRKSTTEMRAPNIARVMDEDTLNTLAKEINDTVGDAQVVIIPAIFGARDSQHLEQLRKLVKEPVYTVATVPISVPGMRMQQQLRSYFAKLGGTYMLGDSVNGGDIQGDKVKYITTVNHEDEHFYADNFILAAGTLLSHGLVSNIDKVFEPVFGLDVADNVAFQQRANINMYEHQAFMGYGVVTDDKFHASRDGKTISNLYACGSILGGCNPLEEGCGGGVAILTALKVASLINA